MKQVEGAKEAVAEHVHRSKKSFRTEDSLLEGWLYRETSVQGLVNQRFGALHSTALVTYRKEGSDAAPTKAWTLEAGCLVSQIQKSEFMIRNKGTSTLWSIARGHHKKAILYALLLRFPAGNLHYKDPLKLCFEEELTARKWREAMLQVINGSSGQKSGPPQDPTQQSEFTNGAEQSYPGTPLQGQEGFASTPRGRTLEQTRSLSSSTRSLADPWEAAGTLPPPQNERRRSTVQHINGVAVYQEAHSFDGRQGAFMVSAVVNASTREVFMALAALGKKTPLGFDWHLIERLDSNSRVVIHTLNPGGFARSVCAPRETVMQQTWREEEDGTITVLAHSVESPKAPRMSSWSWFAPVRAEVEAAGFTIAPLQPRYKHTGESCLVSFVLKIDLGGWLAESSWMSQLLQPWTKQMQDAYLKPLLMSVIALRDQVEQGRYTVQPFMTGTSHHSEPEPAQEAQQEQETPLKPHASRQLKALASMKITAQPERGESGSLKPEPIGEGNEKAESEGFGDVLEEMTGQATLSQEYWSCPGAAGFHVRGPTYLQDHKKIPAEEPIFSLASADLVQIGQRPYHIAPHLPCIRNSKAPFSFVLNLMVPGPQKLALAFTWAAEQAPVPTFSGGRGEPNLARESSLSHVDTESEAGAAPFDVLLARFLAGDDESDNKRRDATVKLIPTVVKGSWVIKQSVGHTPVLLGKKLKTQYHRGANYFEVDVDVGSSRAANSVVGMVQGATTSMIIDMAIVLEGHSEEELPECLLGTVRLTHLDMKAFKVLAEHQENGSVRAGNASQKKDA